jgi:gamma-glutamylaminecyclotransferase
MTRVFVYGTLKRGGSNHDWLRGQRFIAEVRTQPRFRLFDLGGYPGMVEDLQNGLAVEGEVWEVDDAALAGLDELEDVAGGEYVRLPLPLQAPFDGERVDGYLYLLSVAGRPDLGARW